MTVSPTNGAPPAPIKVQFQPYDAMDFTKDHQPLLLFAFEEQPDPVIAARFPEVEQMRIDIEKTTEVIDDMTHYFPLMREGKHIPAILIYVGQRWRRERSRKTRLVFGSINFYQTLRVQVQNAVKKLRQMKYTEATIVLPGRFHPRYLKKDPRGERDEDIFVQAIVESVVIASGSLDAYKKSPKPRIAGICFTHFGNAEQTATHFFNRAYTKGEAIGEAVAEARRLIRLPPDDKVPLLLAGHLLGTEINLRSSASAEWRTIRGYRYDSDSVKASLIYGTEGLRKAGFRLVSRVGCGSRDEPCLLKLHYKPKKEGVKKLSLIGKGVILDTGGLNLKTDRSLEKMHYDMAGAVTVASVFRLVVEKELPIELFALLPLVENAIGSKAGRVHGLAYSYDGQSVEITDTDAEGRLILADSLAYSEKYLRPDVTVMTGTLGDMSDFGPDFLKVITNSPDLEQRAYTAKGRSHEKMVMFPLLEEFNGVNETLVGDISDLKNEAGYHYHSEGVVFISNFLQWDPSPFLFQDISAVFENDADNYGAGPGFGVRWLWEFVRQFAR